MIPGSALIHSNPFDGLASAVRANLERFHFVSREDAARVLEACPDAASGV